MHGRLKVKTTEEQAERKRVEREKKLQMYKGAVSKIFEKRERNELDEEMLLLTGQILSSNPDFYTLWNIRRELFLHWLVTRPVEQVERAMEEELYSLEQCLKVNPKSYSVWQQRGWVLDHTLHPDWTRELALCSKFLEYDERNFHCWDYRRFVVGRGNVSPVAELGFTTTKISANFSNFSSWHYRSKLLPVVHPAAGGPADHGMTITDQPPPQPAPLSSAGAGIVSHSTNVKQETLLEELSLVENAFFTDPNDQSAWFYHRWLLGRAKRGLAFNGVSINRCDGRIIVTLSKATKVGKECRLLVRIDGVAEHLVWSTPLGKYSPVWIATVDKDLLAGTKVRVTFTLYDLPQHNNATSSTKTVKALPSQSQTNDISADDSERDIVSTSQDGVLGESDDMTPGTDTVILPADVAGSSKENVNSSGDCKISSSEDETLARLALEKLSESPEAVGKDVTCQKADEVLVELMETDGDVFRWEPERPKETLFSGQLSTTASAVLTQQLDSLKQLHDIEPDNKWVLLTVLSLMRALDATLYLSETLDYLGKLIDIDPMRTIYYHDLRSRFLMENAISALPRCSSQLVLRSSGLTTTSHLSHLAHLTHLDLSHNALRRRFAEGYLLQGLRTLDLSHNQLTGAEGIGHLGYLERLNLEHNDIDDVESLHSLRTCTRLQTLLLEGNPVREHPAWLQALKECIPSLTL